ncbi:osmotic avoidance abnormal protein 3-like isoform X1 [Daphnia carinata]|uniref:osmotic avoidance abnormal protein 3-like isoform X1 n=2 Tax=Daphnia carinata TaxID=120202 RepID=UPI00257BCA3C|nr:osmotic avoidance abnormal protein 3-like isoform X1 [Daphnia carinata]
MATGSECVRVIVRCRPMNVRESQLNSKNVVQINPSALQCSLLAVPSSHNEINDTTKTFTFDGVYDQTSTTEQLYTDFGYPLVEGVIEGYNATVFAYGQTGSGKSFTMQGVSSPPNQTGILPRAFEHLFDSIAAAEGMKYLVFASYLEIYNEEIRDLLSPDYKRKLELKENSDRGVYVAHLSQHAVNSVDDCQRLMENGWKNRAVGATLMNADSSRSHSLFSISVEMMETFKEAKGEQQSIRRGKLNLVDLAGSERQSKTGATGDRLKEATKINLSLSALGNVISALVDGKSKHIPYRDSKLTRLLQDSLGGNTKTLMIACISPADDNYDETLSTLRYANRAKNIQNRPRINQDPKDAMLREYQKEIERLSQMVDQQKSIEAQNIKPEIVLEQEKVLLQIEYEEKIRQLQREVEKEQETNAKAASEMENVRRAYEADLQKINNSKKKIELDEEAQETLKRLRQIEGNLVGGEKANDPEFRERYWKRKNQSERRRALLAQLLARTEDEDGALLRVYDDIQHEVRVKTEAIKKYKLKLRSLDRDIQDLQSEFERERCDYLETVRRQEQQLRLLHEIIAKVQPLIRKDSNYSDLDHIKQQCIWIDEIQRWKLPEVTYKRTKLPPANFTGMSSYGQYDATAETDEVDDVPHEDRLLQKLKKGEAENLAGRYFASNRAKEIVIRVNNDVHRAKHPAMKGNSLSHSSLNHFPSSMGSSPEYMTGSGNSYLTTNGPMLSSWSAPNALSGQLSGWTSEAVFMNGNVRKPKRLESLTVEAPGGRPMPSIVNNKTNLPAYAPSVIKFT